MSFTDKIRILVKKEEESSWTFFSWDPEHFCFSRDGDEIFIVWISTYNSVIEILSYGYQELSKN